MAETLLSSSNVLLYGRKLTDVALKTDPGDVNANPHNADQLGSNEFLRQQAKDQASAPTLARIYAFSFEGHFYDLARPVVFLVHGDGDPAGPAVPEHRGHAAGAGNEAKGAVPPGSVDLSGVAAKSWDITENIRVWSYDKGDYSIRMDIETGMFEDILLGIECDEDSDEAFYSGSRARVSGSRAQVSGSRARVSGSRARVSGSRARTRDSSD